jgi:hypothetical protein
VLNWCLGSLVAKQSTHFFQGALLCLGIQEVQDWKACDVEAKEDKVCLGANVCNADRPGLRNDDGTEGTARGSKVKTTSTIVGGEDLAMLGCLAEEKSRKTYLCSIDPSSRSESE